MSASNPRARPSGPTFRPIPSLLGAPIAEIEDVGPGDLCLVGLFDDHADIRGFGARFAARQMRYAGEDPCAPPSGSARILDLGDLNVFPLDRLRHESALLRQLGAILAAGGTPIVVGGAPGLGRLMRDALEQATGERAVGLDVPDGRRAVPAGSAATMTVDLSSRSAWTTERPLAALRRAIEAPPPASIRAAHLAGLAPDLGLDGRHEASFGRHVLALIVAHLGKAAD